MRRALFIAACSFVMSHSLAAVPFYWEAKSDEPGFAIDIPAHWGQASRARNGVANVHFEKKDRAGRVAIEVRAYNSDDTDLDQLLLQLRTRLAVKYDRIYLQKRKELTFRKGVEKQVWSVRLGKQQFVAITAFVTQDNKVLQVICITPVKRRKEYEYVFDNALLSFDFSDGSGASSADSGGSNAAAPADATPAPAPALPAIPQIPAGIVPAAPTVPPIAVPTDKKAVPKIEF